VNNSDDNNANKRWVPEAYYILPSFHAPISVPGHNFKTERINGTKYDNAEYSPVPTIQWECRVGTTSANACYHKGIPSFIGISVATNDAPKTDINIQVR